MKYLLAAIAIAALTTPSLAGVVVDKAAYDAAKAEWKVEKQSIQDAWKAAGKPDPKPDNPPDKPKRDDFKVPK